jgi:Domain of unknown function (DUF4168)
MHRTDHDSIGTRLLRLLAAAVLGVVWLLPLPTAHAQNQPQNHPQILPPDQSASSTISDQKLSAAAAAMGQVSTIRQSYEQRIADAPSPVKERLADEANDALEKAVTDQGLSVDEYNNILRTAQNDPAIRRQLAQRIRHSD